MTDRIPPVTPEGCAWMPLTNAGAPGETGVAWRDVTRGWSMAYTLSSAGCWDAAARLMRRLGPRESTSIEFVLWRGDWYGPNFPLPPEAERYAPVRFAGKVPDFGETGRRWLDNTEKVGGRTVGNHELFLRPITLPPLPKPEREEPDRCHCGRVLLYSARKRGDRMCGPCHRAMTGEETEADLRAEVERLQTRLREVEAERDQAIAAYERAQRVIEMRTAERDEAQIELERVREAARARAEPDGIEPDAEDEARIRADEREKIIADLEAQAEWCAKQADHLTAQLRGRWPSDQECLVLSRHIASRDGYREAANRVRAGS